MEIKELKDYQKELEANINNEDSTFDWLDRETMANLLELIDAEITSVRVRLARLLMGEG